MTRAAVWGLLVGLLVAGAACSPGERAQAIRYDAFARRVSDGTVDVYWNCTRPESGLLRLEGAVNSPVVPGAIHDVELTLYGVDGADRDVSRAQGHTADYQVFTMSPSPFRLDLRLVGSEVRFDPRYQYRGSNGGGNSDNGGQSAFVSNLARDICRGL